MAQVLVVDDERSLREFLEIFLRREGHDVTLAAEADSATVALQSKSFDLVLTDLRLPVGSGMDVLRYAQDHCTDTQVILMTAFASTENAVEAMRLGAYDYVTKPVKIEELKVIVERALERKHLRAENVQLKKTLDARSANQRLIGTSTAMREVFELIRKVAPARTNILLAGESGTGKELVARAIHGRGPRAADPFVPVNCGAIPESLIESELFGHKKGSFTGATSDKIGLFEQAADGSVFLDEIGELPLNMQVRLLRVLQERRVRRVGDAADRPIGCRVIAATNRDLAVEVKEGRFREDLYFRLNVIQIKLPSLSERTADIPRLAEAFCLKFAEEQNSPVTRVTDDAMAKLMAYKWPGNIRELENVIERGVTLAAGNTINLDALPPMLRGLENRPVGEAAVVSLPDEGVQLDDILESLERGYLQAALERTGGKKKKAAALVGVSFRTFRYRIAKLGIALGDDDESEADGENES